MKKVVRYIVAKSKKEILSRVDEIVTIHKGSQKPASEEPCCRIGSLEPSDRDVIFYEENIYGIFKDYETAVEYANKKAETDKDGYNFAVRFVDSEECFQKKWLARIEINY